MKRLRLVLFFALVLSAISYAIDSTSTYGELSADTVVSDPLLAPNQGKVLIEKYIYLDETKTVYLQSDGRFFPYNKVGPAAVVIRVDGNNASNESIIDFRSNSAAQH